MWHLNQYFLTIFAEKHAPITFLRNSNLYIFCYKYVCFVLPKKIPTSTPKKTFSKENMILVESWKVELDFRVLARTSIYAFYFKKEVVLLFLHNSHGTPKFINCGRLRVAWIGPIQNRLWILGGPTRNHLWILGRPANTEPSVHFRKPNTETY
jgi:hypothetical protein